MTHRLKIVKVYLVQGVMVVRGGSSSSYLESISVNGGGAEARSAAGAGGELDAYKQLTTLPWGESLQ